MNIEKPVIVFSLDVDWINDEILEWVLNLFNDNGLPVTVFATHETNLLKRLNDYVEIGIHPDFLNEHDHERIITDLLRIYPDARGVRSHGLFEYSNLMNIYWKHNLVWDSTQLLYLCSHISPYRHPSGLIRLPIFWEDDDYFSFDPDWEIESLGLDKPGVKCFDFHPIHLRLNTFSDEQYTFVKDRNFSHESIQDAEYKGNDKGILVFFQRVCHYILKHKLDVFSLGEVCSWV